MSYARLDNTINIGKKEYHNYSSFNNVKKMITDESCVSEDVINTVYMFFQER